MWNGSYLVALALLLSVSALTYAEEFYHDFRGGNFPESILRVTGLKSNKHVQASPDGLRVYLPAGPKPLPPTGVTLPLAIHGNFEITTTYRIRRLGKPQKGYGAGVSLRIEMANPTQYTGVVARFAHVSRGDIYATDLGKRDDEGKRQHKEKYFECAATAGKLRLARRDGVLSYSVAEGEEEEFLALRHEDYGREPIRSVRVCADSGGSPTEVEIVLVDLRVQSYELSASPEVTRSTADWLWIGVGVVVLVALMAAGVRHYRSRRLDRRKAGKHAP